MGTVIINGKLYDAETGLAVRENDDKVDVKVTTNSTAASSADLIGGSRKNPRMDSPTKGSSRTLRPANDKVVAAKGAK